MSNDNGDRRRVSEHYPTLDTEQLIKPINGVITYFQSVSMNELWNNKFTRLLRLSIKIEGNHSKEIPINLQFDWSEPWLYILICSYIILYTFVYFTRRNSTIQSFTFLLTRKYWYSIAIIEHYGYYKIDKIVILIYCHRHFFPQIYCLILVLVVYMAEDLNEFLAKNHK